MASTKHKKNYQIYVEDQVFIDLTLIRKYELIGNITEFFFFFGAKISYYTIIIIKNNIHHKHD